MDKQSDPYDQTKKAPYDDRLRAELRAQVAPPCPVFPELVACPHCGHHLNTPAELAGKLVSCPFCSGQFCVPSVPEANLGHHRANDAGRRSETPVTIHQKSAPPPVPVPVPPLCAAASPVAPPQRQVFPAKLPRSGDRRRNRPAIHVLPNRRSSS